MADSRDGLGIHLGARWLSGVYSTCIFCHSSLGKNEAIENFPVGRRLAFDSNKGRLWAVCSRCGRWNLTPIETRWEAIEQCEREFRATTKRASTDEIGLGRLGEGTDLIRIGKPLRPEFASWRYGRTIRKRAIVAAGSVGVGVLVGVAAAVVSPALIGPFAALVPTAAVALGYQKDVRRSRKYLMQRASLIAGRRLRDEKQIEVRIVQHEDAQGWALRFFGFTTPVDLTGSDALHTLTKIMPALNMMGGFWSNVSGAIAEIESAGTPQNYFRRMAEYARVNRMSFHPIQAFPSAMRFAVEMASQEETERRALVEGELRQLEEDWREAEEIAAIADNLLIPEDVTDRLDDLKRRA
jgi:hypothetical protein